MARQSPNPGQGGLCVEKQTEVAKYWWGYGRTKMLRSCSYLIMRLFMQLTDKFCMILIQVLTVLQFMLVYNNTTSHMVTSICLFSNSILLYAGNTFDFWKCVCWYYKWSIKIVYLGHQGDRISHNYEHIYGIQSYCILFALVKMEQQSHDSSVISLRFEICCPFFLEQYALWKHT